MIKLQDYTPSVYYNESRDFQFIGRIFDVVLNYSKTNVELLHNLPLSQNSDDQFIELLSLTLGFRPRHKYVTSHLRAICSCLTEILRNKGTIKSIILACNAILHADGITDRVTYSYKSEEITNNLKLYLPVGISNTTLLTDLFDYIVPAGLAVDVIKLVQLGTAVETALGTDDNFILWTKDGPDSKEHRTRNTETHNYQYDNTNTLIPQLDHNSNLVEAEVKDTEGILANMQIAKPGGNS